MLDPDSVTPRAHEHLADDADCYICKSAGLLAGLRAAQEYEAEHGVLAMLDWMEFQTAALEQKP
jgi:hypothetical protein